MEQTPRRRGLAATLAVLLPVGVGGALRLWVEAGFPGEAMRGPGGVKAVAALTEGNTGRDWFTWTAASLEPVVGLWGGDARAAAELSVDLGALGSVLGVALLGLALRGPWAALAGGLLAACWGPLLWTSTLIGGDATGTGLAWTGVGLAALGATLGWPGLLLCAVGSGLVGFGAGVKQTALSTAAFLIAVPLLARGEQLRQRAVLGLGSIVAMGLGWAWAARTFLASAETQVEDNQAELSAEALRAAVPALRQLVEQRPDAEIFAQLVALGLLGALLPGRRWLGRGLLGLAGLGALLVVTATVGDKLRPRFLIPAMLPFLALGGAALSAPVDWVRRLPEAARGGIATALAALVATSLLLDGLAWMDAWWRLVQRHEEVGAHSLPQVPRGWTARYGGRFDRIEHSDHSAVGAEALERLASEGPAGGVATVPLRDGREHHLLAAAGLEGIPAVVLSTQRCCWGREEAECAELVVAQLDEAGARLLLPTVDKDLSRHGGRDPSWSEALRLAAEARSATSGTPLTRASRYWWSWEGSGSGGALPCPARSRPPPRRSSGS